MRAAEAGAGTLAELRRERDHARAEYLAATRQVPRDTAERSRLWRAFTEANAAYCLRRAEGEPR